MTDVMPSTNGTAKQLQNVVGDHYGGSGDQVQLIGDAEFVGDREIPASPSSDQSNQRSEISPLQLEGADAIHSKKKTQEGLRIIIISSVSFAVTVTIALIITIFLGPPAVAPHGAVACDNQRCSDVGVATLKRGGSAVDAAISTLLCMGVVHPHHSGLGGGFFMLIRQHKDNASTVINARETAPGGATEALYTNEDDLKTGILSVAVPGSLSGMTQAHAKYGKLSWKDVVSPVVDIARDGFTVSKSLASAVARSIDPLLAADADLRGMFYRDGRPVQEGSTLTMPGLAAVLDDLAQHGADIFYKGKYAQEIFNATAGAITADDLVNYKISQVQTLKNKFRDMILETMPAPGGGPLVVFILQVLQNYTLSKANETEPLYYHRLVETIKFMMGERYRFADPLFVDTVENATKLITSLDYATQIRDLISDNNTHDAGYYLRGAGVTPDAGTAHVSVIGPGEDMVSVTSSINQLFGSHVVTSSGVILNNMMYDFDLPQSANPAQPVNKNNNIEPGKRPLSSMSPTIVHRHGKPCAPRIALGGINGTQIISGVAEVLLNLLVFEKDITSAIEAKRLTNFLVPDALVYDSGFPQPILDDLASRGHTGFTEDPRGINFVHGVAKINETVMAHSDTREGGSGASEY